MYIYADIFLALNIILNGTILVLTAWTAGMALNIWRVLGAAVLGSMYALGELTGLPGVLYTPLAKFLVSLVIVLTAFPIKSFRSLTIAVACFYLISLLLGGAVIGWLYFLQPADRWSTGEIAWGSVSWKHLAAGGAIAFLLAVLAFRRLAASLLRRQMLFRMAISYNGCRVELVSRLDTGNELYTVLERKPVILVSRQALEPLLSEEVNTYLKTIDPASWLADLDKCRDVSWLSRIQVIPYRGVGASSILLGFRPDDLKVLTKAGWRGTGVAVVGIVSARIASDDSYQALLHPAVMQCINAKEGAGICA
jgi:stage II sporulation protein GA (sporulation sigma-E factor processing peptidase)